MTYIFLICDSVLCELSGNNYYIIALKPIPLEIGERLY